MSVCILPLINERDCITLSVNVETIGIVAVCTTGLIAGLHKAKPSDKTLSIVAGHLVSKVVVLTHREHILLINYPAHILELAVDSCIA